MMNQNLYFINNRNWLAFSSTNLLLLLLFLFAYIFPVVFDLQIFLVSTWLPIFQ